MGWAAAGRNTRPGLVGLCGQAREICERTDSRKTGSQQRVEQQDEPPGSGESKYVLVDWGDCRVMAGEAAATFLVWGPRRGVVASTLSRFKGGRVNGGDTGEMGMGMGQPSRLYGVVTPYEMPTGWYTSS